MKCLSIEERSFAVTFTLEENDKEPIVCFLNGVKVTIKSGLVNMSGVNIALKRRVRVVELSRVLLVHVLGLRKQRTVKKQLQLPIRSYVLH